MNDRTIVKPRPGRGAVLSRNTLNKPTIADSSRTVVREAKPDYRNQNTLLAMSGNPIVDSAGTLLSICIKLRGSNYNEDVDALKVQCIELIKHYEQLLRTAEIQSEDIQSARYCLCCFIDEVVLTTPWGQQSEWASNSLLSTFHNETFGGEHFFTLLENTLQSTSEKYRLLELMYLCITLGFVGKMKLEPQGSQKLEDLRDKAYHGVQRYKSELNRDLSPGWRDKVAEDEGFQQPFPLWVIGALLGVVMLFIYMGFSYSINNYSSTVYKELVTLVPWQQNEDTAGKVNRDEALMLQQLLQTEISRNLLEVEQLADRVRIRIGAGVLFASGSTQPRVDFETVLAKIARTLEGTKGKILITGHTDDTPIFTTKYPSNWHLSLARATSIGNYLANNASLSGRLWPEGKGESEPRNSNTNEENRALNRRIEIDLLF